MSSQTLPPPQGPEYTPCACSHIEPEHRPDVGPCLVCDCGAYRPPAAAPAGPAPATDRAAVLLEAADFLRGLRRTGTAITVEEMAAELRRLAGEAQQDERCTRCRHPKRDHDGRADHRAKYSPLVAGEPWCHACNAECDYSSEAQQDRECSASISGNCLREAQSETACNTEDGECVHGGQPAREAQQDPTQDGTAPRSATVAWDFEGEYEADKWHGIGTTYRNGEYDQALAYLDRRAETDKQHRRIRMVRAATTYTVEAERTPTAVERSGQPETDPET
jgi:hypothetical protein